MRKSQSSRSGSHRSGLGSHGGSSRHSLSSPEKDDVICKTSNQSSKRGSRNAYFHDQLLQQGRHLMTFHLATHQDFSAFLNCRSFQVVRKQTKVLLVKVFMSSYLYITGLFNPSCKHFSVAKCFLSNGTSKGFYRGTFYSLQQAFSFQARYLLSNLSGWCRSYLWTTV